MKRLFVCRNCGKEYYSQKPNSKYCSRECRKEYNNVECNCAQCGKKMTIYRNKYEKVLSGELKHIYCSKECTTKAQTKKMTKVCEYCGKEYEIENAFKDVQKFCSRECYENHRSENSFSRQKTVCPICGKIYYPKHRNQTYCSRKCRGVSQRNENSDIGQYLRANNQCWKKRILESRGHKCELSGETNNLTIHHIRSFSLILKETLEKLDLKHFRLTYEYTDEELEMLRNAFREVQNKYDCVIIHENIHKLFHSKYGYGDNTEEQWDEFIEEYKEDFKQIVA